MPLKNDFGNVQDLVEIREIREGTVVMKNGGLRQVMMVGGVNFSLKSEEEQNIITQGYQNFLNGVSFPLQIIIHSRKINIDRYLARLEGLKGKQVSPLLEEQIGEYEEFVRGFVKDNPIMQKTFFVVVPYTPVSLQVARVGGGILDSLPFFGGKKNPADAKKTSEERAAAEAAGFEEAVVQLKQRVSQVTQGLFAIGLETVVLSDEQLIELFYNFYNPETVEKKTILVR